jgi:hypothetical protein
MAINRSEEFAVGNQNKLFLRALPDVGRHPAFEGDQVVLMAIRIPAIPSHQLAPGRRLRLDWLEAVAVLDFSVRQCQETIPSVWKAGCDCYVADPHRITGMGKIQRLLPPF